MKKFFGTKIFYKSVFSIMLPILLQNVITNFVNLLDNVMVGQVGTEPMSGVAIVNQLIFVFNLALFGGISGAGIFTAQFYGKADSDGVRYTFRMKWYIALAIWSVFFAIFIGFGDKLIALYINDGSGELNMDAAMGYAKSYMKIILIQMLPFAVTQIYADTLRETGETLLPMKAGIAAVCVNLFFNYVLIFGKFGAKAMGVSGAAIATVLSRFVELAIVVLWTHRHKERNPFIVGAYSTPKLPLQLAKNIIVTGVPLTVNELLWSSSVAVMNQCYSVRGLEAISAINIENTVFELFFCACLSMGNTISIMVGRLLGAGEIDRAVDEDRKLIAFAVMMNFAIGILMGILAPVFPLAYNTTETVRKLAGDMMLVMAVMMPPIAFTNSCYFTLRSGGKVIITFIFDSLYQWVLCVPLMLVLSRYTQMTVLHMFMCVQSLEIVKCLLGYFMVKQKKWAVNLVEY